MQVDLNAMELLFIKTALDNMSATFYNTPNIRVQYRELQQKVNSSINTYPENSEIKPSAIKVVDNSGNIKFPNPQHPYLSDVEK